MSVGNKKKVERVSSGDTGFDNAIQKFFPTKKAKKENPTLAELWAETTKDTHLFVRKPQQTKIFLLSEPESQQSR